MQTTIWLLRHAETSDPTVFHGLESDIGLSEHGQQQAQVVAEWLRPFSPTVVVSSGMQRAIDTAKPIADTVGVRPNIEPQLHERRIGALCGEKFNLKEGPWVDTLREWQAGNIRFTTPGAESFEELQTRLVPAFQRVANLWPGERIVIVAHGIVCKVLLLSLLEGWSAQRWSELGRIENIATSELVGNSQDGWIARSILQVPEPVAQLNHLARTRLQKIRSEA
jgi:2,3-bisphosphoglycerate-dependent phosphoglycerate mutase